MLIHEPEVQISNNEVIVRSRIETVAKSYDFPNYLWYTFPLDYRDGLIIDSTPFLASMLMLSMWLGEDMEVRGDISPRVAQNLPRYTSHMIRDYPRLFSPIDLNLHNIKPTLSTNQNRFSAMPYSGGIDSNFTVWKLRVDRKNPFDEKLIFAIFVLGATYHYDDFNSLNAFMNTYQSFLGKYGITLFPSRTNYREFYNYKIDYSLAYGGFLYAIGMLFGNLVEKYYISSSDQQDIKHFHGTSPIIDPLFSTENTKIIHYDPNYPKIQKTEALKHWYEVQNKIFVCSFEQPGSVKNCGKCKKCIRQLLFYDLFDMRKATQTISKDISIFTYIEWGIKDYQSPHFFDQYINKAKEMQKTKSAFLAEFAKFLSSPVKIFRQTTVRIFSKKALYEVKRIIYGKYKLLR